MYIKIKKHSQLQQNSEGVFFFIVEKRKARRRIVFQSLIPLELKI